MLSLVNGHNLHGKCVVGQAELINGDSTKTANLIQSTFGVAILLCYVLFVLFFSNWHSFLWCVAQTPILFFTWRFETRSLRSESMNTILFFFFFFSLCSWANLDSCVTLKKSHFIASIHFLVAFYVNSLEIYQLNLFALNSSDEQRVQTKTR